MALLDKARAAMPAKPAPLAKAAASAPSVSRQAAGALPLPPAPVLPAMRRDVPNYTRTQSDLSQPAAWRFDRFFFFFFPLSLPPVTAQVASTACSGSDVTEDRVDVKTSKAASAPKGGKVSLSVSKVHVLELNLC